MPSPFKFRYNDNAPPGSAQAGWQRWHQETRLRAAAILGIAGGFLSGRELAEKLGMKPHGLRQCLLLDGDDLITVEIRRGKSGRGEPWYRLKTEERDPPPPLIAHDQPPTTRRFRLCFLKQDNCGPDDRSRAQATSVG